HAAPTPILRPAFLPLSTIPVCSAAPIIATHLAHHTAAPPLSSCSLGRHIDICTATCPSPPSSLPRPLDHLRCPYSRTRP
ncbi:hypothetical protein B0H14DRAFT_2966096, partial [Mycena olivaceomarginata]